jgi:hypothetical protein
MSKEQNLEDKDKALHIGGVNTRTYDEEFDEVDCEYYEYEIGLEDNDEICHLGIGIDNCGHCFKNKALYVC